MHWKRGKRNIIADFKTRDIYKFYKEKYKDKAKDYRTFCGVWKKFMEIRMQMVIFDNLELHMPHRLGSLRIRLGKDVLRLDKTGEINYRKIAIDWGRTKKEWGKLYPDKTAEDLKHIKGKPLYYCLNGHTDGRKLHWHWDKITSNIKNKSAYRIKMTRTWNNMLVTKIKKTKILNYYE